MNKSKTSRLERKIKRLEMKVKANEYLNKYFALKKYLQWEIFFSNNPNWILWDFNLKSSNLNYNIDKLFLKIIKYSNLKIIKVFKGQY